MTPHEKLLKAALDAARLKVRGIDGGEMSDPERTAAVAAARAVVRHLYQAILGGSVYVHSPDYIAGVGHAKSIVRHYLDPEARTAAEDEAGKRSIIEMEKYTHGPVLCWWCSKRAVTYRREIRDYGLYPSCGGNDCGLTNTEFEEKS